MGEHAIRGQDVKKTTKIVFKSNRYILCPFHKLPRHTSGYIYRIPLLLLLYDSTNWATLQSIAASRAGQLICSTHSCTKSVPSLFHPFPFLPLFLERQCLFYIMPSTRPSSKIQIPRKAFRDIRKRLKYVRKKFLSHVKFFMSDYRHVGMWVNQKKAALGNVKRLLERSR